MASKVYPKAIELLNAGTLNWTADTIRILLVNASGSYNRTHGFVSAVVANELSGGSYARQTLGTKTSADNGTDKWIFDAADVTFTAVAGGQTAAAAIVYKFITNDAASPVLAFLDGVDVVANGGDITVQFAATGVFNLAY
ncbi:hypothetical protein H6F75_00590 [Nodosilinea sp. FACHB-131]|uniref:hypothetical protein n=1 Tax=Cyanophyceae TaxID=3028117 RepID=UPI0016832286|nr:hypothetical protein [Nodosilinea sp. FACHB-131]MBD1871968.1 hypothetical protein [Nodosilinea sp. FACHB-131]